MRNFVNRERQARPEEEHTPFKSKSVEYIFYLTVLEGEQRMKALHTPDACYSSKKVAAKWKENIWNQIVPTDHGAEKALEKLDAIHKVMVS